MKKLIAVLMCIAMLLSLAACSQPAKQQAGGNTEIKDPEVSGMLLLSMSATVTISYDKDGLAMTVAGNNDLGENIAASFDDVLGSSCAQVVTDLIAAIADTPYARELNVVVLKQVLGSQIPTDNFLEGIRMDAEKAAADRAVVLITADMLSEDSLFSLDAAKEILTKQLGLEDAALEGNPELENDKYRITVTHEGTTDEYTVDANNGLVELVPFDADPEDALDTPSDEYYDSTTDMTEEEYDPSEDAEDIIGGEDEVTDLDPEDSTEDTTADA